MAQWRDGGLDALQQFQHCGAIFEPRELQFLPCFGGAEIGDVAHA